jgi:hypothetical protein
MSSVCEPTTVAPKARAAVMATSNSAFLIQYCIRLRIEDIHQTFKEMQNVRNTAFP